ncbi:hypothetical protein [Streptomyces sp. NPDC002215]|uniref:hypothetical protein n=1 Tax=Streptomyces sp. NPDC002215 TaxID=3154412 RepID=UPI0033209794
MRLQLSIERSWEDLGAVDAAMFRTQKIDFALSRLEGNPCRDVFVWVSRAQTDIEAALDILLDALEIGAEAITFRANEGGVYVDLRNDLQP